MTTLVPVPRKTSPDLEGVNSNNEKPDMERLLAQLVALTIIQIPAGTRWLGFRSRCPLPSIRGAESGKCLGEFQVRSGLIWPFGSPSSAIRTCGALGRWLAHAGAIERLFRWCRRVVCR